jgi:RNA polymerase sigma factor (sigma-70 family)
MDSKVMSKDIPRINKNITLDSHIHRRDKEAVAALHAKYFPRIKHHIASSVGSAADAEDLAQDVFVEFYKGKGHFSKNGNLEKYLFGIAKNMVRGYYLKRERSVKTISIEEIDTPTTTVDTWQQHDPVNFIERQEFIKVIEEALTKLPPKAKEAIKLRFINGLNSKEAAKKAGCSTNTFYQRLFLGIKALVKLENRLLKTEIREVDQ